MRSIARAVAVCALAGLGVGSAAHGQVPVHVSFLWHMHQPRYIPDLGPFGSDPFFSYSVPDIHNQRSGPYTTWPAAAVDRGSFMPHHGAHVSFSGSLIENLNELEASGINGGMWTNWKGAYRAKQQALPANNRTALGNARLDMIGFGYFHPLMPLIDEKSIRLQLAMHRVAMADTFGVGQSPRGLFPPETAFSTRMIPALVAEGLEWVLVDNIHFDRACIGYPHTDATGLARPNRADQVNPDPSTQGGRWVQLQNLWAPSRVSAPFGYQPHRAQHIDPNTGASTSIVVVPGARYEGNEDGRGGYGAFLYAQVMDAYRQDNTDPQRPMIVVLHHDGDNFGGGSEAYYNSNYQNMVNWDAGDPNYETTSINDYLDRFPVPQDALIHVVDGSWAGADSGDSQFKKWLGGDVSAGSNSPDINSWAAVTAAHNVVATLDQVQPVDPANEASIRTLINGTGGAVHRAWRWLLVSQASDYWYWDGTEVWDSNPTRGANMAVSIASPEIQGVPGFVDQTPPSVFMPQRIPYNPGEIEFGSTPQPSDFEVWTLAYDWSGLESVTLKWRIDHDGFNPLESIQNETYAGGHEVGPWQSVPMSASVVQAPAGVLAASRKAMRYGAMITGQRDVLIDYYVEAVDASGNIQRSAISHVWVGDGSGGGGGGERVVVDPLPLIGGESATILYTAAGGPLAGASQVYAHVGFDGWSGVFTPDPQMDDGDGDGIWELSIAIPPEAGQLNLVFNNGAGVWDNNNGQDWAFPVQGQQPAFVMDGALDPSAVLIAERSGVSLWAAVKGSILYVATTPASGAGGLNDRFLAVAGEPGALRSAMWSKSGRVAEWDAFVGNESANGFAGWFDAAGPTQIASGIVLEGTLDLVSELGAVPEVIHLAALSYQTMDGGSLVPSLQVPMSLDGDGDVQIAEYAAIRVCAIDPDRDCCPGDIADDFGFTATDGGGPDGVVDFGDFVALLGLIGPCDSGSSGCLGDIADDFGFTAIDGGGPDGVVDFGDFVALLGLIGPCQ